MPSGGTAAEPLPTLPLRYAQGEELCVAQCGTPGVRVSERRAAGGVAV